MQEIQIDRITMKSRLPVKQLLALKISHELNTHGRLWMKAVIEYQDILLRAAYRDEEIQVLENREDGTDSMLFRGRIEKTSYAKENQMLIIEVCAVTDTVVLDRRKQMRSFQNINMSYKDVAAKVIKDQKARFIWGIGENPPIKLPIIQYEETDWEFLIRLASHFHASLYADLVTGTPAFWFGGRPGSERGLDGAEIIENGFSASYYTRGAYEEGISRTQSFTLKLRHRQEWQLGDYVLYKGGRYMVYQRSMELCRGELVFIYSLGTKRILYRNKIFHEGLAGLRLEGMVKMAEQESVYLQLDMDQGEGEDVPLTWSWPWTPETGNLCYCMPEAGTRAVLYLPTHEEQDGCAVQLLRHNGNGGGVQDKEFATIHDKKMGLYPDRLFLEGKDKVCSVLLSDEKGIELNTKKSISLLAEGSIRISGKSLAAAAPVEVALKTDSSNIDIFQDFNFYAPNGVKTRGHNPLGEKHGPGLSKPGNPETGNPECEIKAEHWQASFSALAAVPAVDFQNSDADGVVDLMACGSVPKIAGSSTVVAMKEVMEGKKEAMTTYPDALKSMEIYTFKGGYRLPEKSQ